MNIPLITVVVLTIITSILLIIAILLQNPKDEMGQSLGSMGIQQIVGVAQMSHLIEKITYFLAAFLLILIISSTYLIQKEDNARYATHQEMTQSHKGNPTG